MVTILIADDSSYIRSLLKKILSESGHIVVSEAGNGDEAINQYEKLRPEVVLMDIVLETGKITKTGLDAIRQIISFDPQANIIVCSGLDEQSLISESMSAGAKAFVAKPIEPNKLLQTIIMCSDLRIIAEMGKIGAVRAASVLSKLTKQPIHVELLKLEVEPLHLVAGLSGAADRLVTVIRMGLQTEPNCEAFLVFEPSEATKIASIMTEFSGGSQDEEIQMSAVKELGSNVICAFFAAVADFSELSLVPTTPTIITDAFEAVVDVFLAQQAMAVNSALSALIYRIQLKRKTGTAHGFFILIPSADFQKKLIEVGKKSSCLISSQKEANMDSAIDFTG